MALARFLRHELLANLLPITGSLPLLSGLPVPYVCRLRLYTRVLATATRFRTRSLAILRVLTRRAACV